MNVSYKFILRFFIGMIKYPQSSQNSMFVMSLQYLKKKVRDEVNSLDTDKHEGILQIHTIIFGLCDQTCPNYPK